MGFVRGKPDPLSTSLLAPGASGSEASALWSPRNFQPLGACANAGAIASSATNANPTKCFISVPPQEMASPNHTPVLSQCDIFDLHSVRPPRRTGATQARGSDVDHFFNPIGAETAATFIPMLEF